MGDIMVPMMVLRYVTCATIICIFVCCLAYGHPLEGKQPVITVGLELADRTCIPCLSRIMYIHKGSYGRMSAQLKINVLVSNNNDIAELDSMGLDSTIYSIGRKTKSFKKSLAHVTWSASGLESRVFRLPIEETKLIKFVDSLALHLDFTPISDGNVDHLDKIEIPAHIDPNLLDCSQQSYRLLLTANNGDRILAQPGHSDLNHIPYSKLVPDSLQQRLMAWMEMRFVDDTTLWCMYTTNDAFVDTIINGEVSRLYTTVSLWRTEVTLGHDGLINYQHRKTRTEEVPFNIWSSASEKRIVIPNIREGFIEPPKHFNIVYQNANADSIGAIADKVPIEFFPRRFQLSANIGDTIILGQTNCLLMKVYPRNRMIHLKSMFEATAGLSIVSIQTVRNLFCVSYSFEEDKVGAVLVNSNGVRQSPFYILEGGGRIVATDDGTNIRFYSIVSEENRTTIQLQRTMRFEL